MIAIKGAPPKPMSLPPSTRVDLRIGAYQPCFEIGSGGMASVYIAKELGISGLQRTVALKVMHEHLSKQMQFRKRFLDEARVLTHIAHPYVCRVLGFGEEGDRPYMAMEYLVGEPLSRVLRAMKRREEGLPTARRARLFSRAIADLAEGIHAAHETRDGQGNLLGVVHRDVTPQNLFVLYDGTVRVLDFGIARYRDRHVHTATTGHLFGKLPYMAPEQVMGEPYDRRVDVWALGVVLWELVTLGRLFKRETEMRTMRAVCSDPIPSVSTTVSDVPEGLSEILDRALARDPEHRYKTARELSHALELWLSRTGDPVTHADLSDFLNGFFPGSEHERRRWAEEATPGSGIRLPMDAADEDLDTTTFKRLMVAPLGTEEPTRVERPTSSRTRPSQLGPLPALRAPSLEIAASPVAEERVSPSVEPALEATKEVTRPRASLRPARSRRRVGVAATILGVGVAVAALIASTALLGPSRTVRALQPGAAPASFGAANVMGGAPSLGAEMFSGERWRGLSAAPTPEPAVRTAVRSTPRADATPAPSDEASEATGDLLVLSGSPEVRVRVYLGDRFLGVTPVRTRLPAGVVGLSVQVNEGGARIPMSTQVAPGRVNLLTVGVGD